MTNIQNLLLSLLTEAGRKSKQRPQSSVSDDVRYWHELRGNRNLEKILINFIEDGLKKYKAYDELSLQKAESERNYETIIQGLNKSVEYAIESLTSFKEGQSLEVKKNTIELIEHLKKVRFDNNPTFVKELQLSMAKLFFIYIAWYYRMQIDYLDPKNHRGRGKKQSFIGRANSIIGGIKNRDNLSNPDPENYLANLFFSQIPETFQRELVTSNRKDLLGIDKFLKQLWEKEQEIRELEKTDGTTYKRPWGYSQAGPEKALFAAIKSKLSDEDVTESKILPFIKTLITEAVRQNIEDIDWALDESMKGVQRALIRGIFFTRCDVMTFAELEDFVVNNFYTEESDKHIGSKNSKEQSRTVGELPVADNEELQGAEMSRNILEPDTLVIDAFKEETESKIFKNLQLFSELDDRVFAAVFIAFLYDYVVPKKLDILTLPKMPGEIPVTGSLLTWLNTKPRSKYKESMQSLSSIEGQVYNFNIAIPDFFNIFSVYLDNANELSIPSKEYAITLTVEHNEKLLNDLDAFGKKYGIDALKKQGEKEVTPLTPVEQKEFLTVLDEYATNNAEEYGISPAGVGLIHKTVQTLQQATTETVNNKYIKLAEVLYNTCTKKQNGINSDISLIASVCKLIKNNQKEYSDTEGYAKVHQIRMHLLSTTNPNKKGLANANVAGKATDLIKFGIELPKSNYPEAEALFFAEPSMLEAILTKLKDIKVENNEPLLAKFDKRSNPGKVLEALIYKIDFILRFKKATSIITEALELPDPKKNETKDQSRNRFLVESFIIIDSLVTYGRTLIKYLRNLSRERDRLAMFFDPEQTITINDMSGIRRRLNISPDDPSGNGLSFKELSILTKSFIYNLEKNNTRVFKQIVDNAELNKLVKFCRVLKTFIKNGLIYSADLKGDNEKVASLENFYVELDKFEATLTSNLQQAIESERIPIDLSAIRYYLKLHKDDIKEKYGDFTRRAKEGGAVKNPMIVALDKLLSSSYFGPALGIYPETYIDPSGEETEEREALSRQKREKELDDLISRWE